MTHFETTGPFRVLLVDDEINEHSRVRSAFASFGDRIELKCEEDVEVAWRTVLDQYVDLVILDVFGVNDMPIGLEFMRRIAASKLSTRVLFVSQFDLEPVTERLLELNSSSAASLLAGYVDKRDVFPSRLKHHVEQELAQFEPTAVTSAGLAEVAQLIADKRHRYKAPSDFNLRESVDEISVELDRVLRSLFGLRLDPDHAPRVHVRLNPVARHGLSAAVAVNAFVNVELDTLDPARTGHQVVVKFGPKDDIKAEADRFLAYVRYGVEMAQRVELLNAASKDAVGALAYSFAGALYDAELVSLDDAMVRELEIGKSASSQAVLRGLFATHNWYSIKCPEADLSSYFKYNQRSDLKRSHKEAESMLAKLDDFNGSGVRISKVEKSRMRHASMQVKIPGRKSFFLPGSSILGSARLATVTPGCLVHGDLHGGNVLVDGRGDALVTDYSASSGRPRTCLIDFRNAGPGPRCIDAVALESSIRLADVSVAIKSDSLDRGLLRQRDPGELARTLASRYAEDRILYRYAFFNAGKAPTSPWAQLCLTVFESMRSAFNGEITLDEYLSVSLRYTIRMLGFKLDSYSRIRMAAWLGAQYSLLDEMDTHV